MTGARQGGKTSAMEFLLLVSWAWYGLGFVRFPDHVEFMRTEAGFDQARRRAVFAWAEVVFA